MSVKLRIQAVACVVVFFTLCPGFTEAQELGKWFLRGVTDRFGDETGEYGWGYAVIGEGTNSIGSKSMQLVMVAYHVERNVVGFILKDMSSLSMPLNMLFMGPEAITLYLKDTANKTYSFSGMQMSDEGAVLIAMNQNVSLLSLLRRKDIYKAVIEGDRWSCSFRFEGGMPQ